MNQKKIGFIGCGNMARAIVTRAIKTNVIEKENIRVSDHNPKIARSLAAELGAVAVSSNATVVEECDIVFLTVKPQFYQQVISEIKSSVSEEKIIISVAPAHSLEKLEGMLGSPRKIVRTMPNTPALVGEGMTAVCANSQVTESELAGVVRLLESFGKVGEVEEYLMDAVVSVSGSAPAYVYIFIEAMADAAVLEGMPRAMAYSFAAQAVYGSAKMVIETGMHPGTLKDMVCSPGGTTIEAVATLEEFGFRNTVIKAMKACAKKTKEMR